MEASPCTEREFHFQPPSGPAVVVRACCAAVAPNHRICDGDQTGEVPWAAMPALCYFLLSEVGQQLIAGKTVLELGAGIGLPGLLAGKSCSHLTLTDGNPAVVDLLRRNVALNPPSGPCTVALLPWGRDRLPLGLPRHDVLLGSDVFYSADAVESFFETVDALLEDGGVLVLSYVSRWAALDHAVSVGAAKAGFSLRQYTGIFLPAEESNPGTVFIARRGNGEPDPGPCTLDGNCDVLVLSPSAFQPSRLVQCSGLRELSLRGDGPVILSEAQCQAVASLLPQLPALEALDLSRNFFERHITHITAGLRHCTSLRSLIIASNVLGPEGAAALSATFPDLPMLGCLDATCNGLGDAGLEHLLGTLPPSCTELRLSDNNIRDAGAGCLAQALKVMSRMDILDLSVNDIGPTGAMELAMGLSQCTALRCLDLNMNQIGANGLLCVVDGLKKCSLLETLLLRSNWVASWAVPPLAAALPALPALRRLALASNNLPAEAAAPLAAALPVCPALTELDVANNALGREGALALAEAAVGCSALRCLRLAGNLTGAASATVHAAQVTAGKIFPISQF